MIHLSLLGRAIELLWSCLVTLEVQCFERAQKSLDFEVINKWQAGGGGGRGCDTCAHNVVVGHQEGAHKTVSVYLQSASAKMMLGFLPPSSSVTLFRLLFPAASWISLPTCGGGAESRISPGPPSWSPPKSPHQWDAVINKSCSTNSLSAPGPLKQESGLSSQTKYLSAAPKAAGKRKERPVSSARTGSTDRKSA